MCGKWARALVVLIALGVVGAAAWQAPIACAWVPANPDPPPPPLPDPDPLPDPGPIDPPPVDPPCHHSPEPSTMVLAGMGAAALAAGAIRRRKAA